MSQPGIELEFWPLTADRWRDFGQLFGERGAFGGCWCMWWRTTRAEFERQKGEGNRQAMQAIVESGQIPGILAYSGGEPMAWCSVAPREHFPVLQRSRNLKPVDDTPVWSIVCYFVDKRYRRRGMSRRLLQAAVDYIRDQGGRVAEGYPVDLGEKRMTTTSGYTGFASVYRDAGFVECLRRSETLPIMRLHLYPDAPETEQA